MLEAGAGLAIVNIQFHVKYDSSQFLHWVLDIFECSSFNFFMLESEGSKKKTTESA